jgi:hypothetical protein
VPIPGKPRPAASVKPVNSPLKIRHFL